MIVCQAPEFDVGSLPVGQPVQAEVIVNQIADSMLNVEISPQKLSAVSVSPRSVSPVLKTDLVITLMADYPEEVRAEDFTVHLVKPDDEEFRRELRVKSVDNSSKTLTVRFAGAPSGEYALALRSKSLGVVDGSSLVLTTEAKVTRIRPKQGSLYGGTLITIDGENFSDDKLDNPVMVGSSLCIVERTSKNQIVCRIEERGQSARESTEEVSVLLKLGEYAVCATRNRDCSFDFV